MADTDGGGLLVQIGVTQARMERELAQVVKQAAKAAQQAEDAFKGANDNIGKGAAAAFGKLPQQANQAGAAIKNTSGYTANLASQLNDIGVQLAGGQSPFLIMIQQGTQISQLFQQTGGNIKSFGSILTGAITSALNPFSLLTFAVIGLGGAAVQYFASVISGGEDANKVIEEQAKLVQNVAKTWGDAVPALQAYVDALANAKDAAELIKASEGLASDQWAVARKEIETVNVSFADLIDQLQTVGESPEIIFKLTNSFADLRDKVESGKATQEDFRAVQDALAAAIGSTGIPALNDFATTFAGLGQAIAGATAQAMRFRQEALNALAIGKNGPALGTLSPLFSENGKFQTQESFQPKDVPTPESRPLIELQGLPGEYKADGSLSGKKRGGGSKRGANAYKDEVAGIKERTAALRESTAAQAAVNPLVNDYGFALEKAKAEQKLLADAQRAGLSITPTLRDQISELATGYAQASVEAKQLSESQKEIKKNAEEWASLEKDVFKGFISDLKDGKSGAEALSNALEKVANKLLDMALDGIFSTKGGAGGGGGLFSSLLGGIGKVLGFASGTANTGGKRGKPVGVVHGQEAVIPLPAGGKVPVQLNSPAASDLAKKSSRDFVNVTLTDDSGRMADIADQRIHTASGTIVQVSVTQSYKQVKSNMASLITDTQQRSL
ncbi:phage tail length tape measure family protein [Rhizobium leguminosarum]|uniref:phage tail length tape measure family protein n=1 Tax=Rhizobium leguminosarum TaxID=384 RepID=UPI0014418A64|nr:phage tail length tape measure family protein [Rhizobium leguminosarum]MBY5863266.1 hypothetical protein [Rhizobium leguminosarum]NKM04146.1 hypothetical protein [Rhizobium leguminosarum bv. viciae]